MTAVKLHSHHFRIERFRNKPPLTGIETDELTRNLRRFHGTLFVVVADRCPASHSGLDLRVRRFALEFDAAKKRPRSVAAFRADRARIERARIEARSASPVCQQPFWSLQGTRQRQPTIAPIISEFRSATSRSAFAEPTWSIILSAVDCCRSSSPSVLVGR